MLQIVHGRLVKRVGGRFIAVPKSLGRADRIAARSNIRGNWQKVETWNRTARVIYNYR